MPLFDGEGPRREGAAGATDAAPLAPVSLEVAVGEFAAVSPVLVVVSEGGAEPLCDVAVVGEAVVVLLSEDGADAFVVVVLVVGLVAPDVVLVVGDVEVSPVDELAGCATGSCFFIWPRARVVLETDVMALVIWLSADRSRIRSLIKPCQSIDRNGCAGVQHSRLLRVCWCRKPCRGNLEKPGALPP